MPVDRRYSAAKIRPALGVGKAGMKNADAFSVRGFERVALETLVLPDGLEEAFGRRIIFVVQHVAGAALRAPVGVKISSRGKHAKLLLRRVWRKVNGKVDG